MLGILSASLALTLLLETTAAALWGLRRQNLLLGVMVNLLTNPAAVLLHQLFPGWGVTLVLEGADWRRTDLGPAGRQRSHWDSRRFVFWGPIGRR